MSAVTPKSHEPLRGRSTLVAFGFVFALAICWTWPAFRQLQADSYRLLYQGRWIVQHGLPYREVFTVAAGGRSFADQQWLAELFGYEAWRIAGYGGFALLSATAFASGFALLAALMRRRGASVALAISCATLALLGSYGVTFLRAQVLVVPLFVALLWLCLADADQDVRRQANSQGREAPRARLRLRFVLVVPLLALWANLHGSVLIGVALAGTYVCYRAAIMARRGQWRTASAYGFLAVAIALTPIATPYGTHVLVYYEHMIGNSAIGIADVEWASPAFLSVPYFQFVAPLALALVCLCAISRHRRPPWVLIGMLGLTGLAAALEMRDNLWLAIAAFVIVAETTAAWLPSRPSTPRFLVGLSTAAIALAVLGVLPPLIRSSAGFQSQTPLRAIAAAASYAAAHPRVHVLADDTSASALLWLDPRLAGRVGFDGELEAYPPSALIKWIGFETADSHGWLGAARGYRLLVGATAFAPALVARLARVAGGSVLAHDTRGIAVLQPEPSPARPARRVPAPARLRAVTEATHA